MTTVLVIGSGQCVWEDLEIANSLTKYDVVIGINDMIPLIPHLDEGVSMHPEKMPGWLKSRRRLGYPDPRVWTARHKIEFITENIFWFESVPEGCGSGFLATHIAYNFFEAHKIVLAGVPMQAEQKHFFTDDNWKEAWLYHAYWKKEQNFPKYVRSCSGWTKELLGYPTKEWLEEGLSVVHPLNRDLAP